MCGIAGWIDWEINPEHHIGILEKMVDTLKYRGPDASGFWFSDNAAIGHRRLIVVDPAGGGQPMIREKAGKKFVITYNGELYNTSELRRELSVSGYTFEGHSDTEVLLNAYIEWGPDCIEKLNGIYAFGIWNESDKSLFLARDRLGVKPLFYTQKGSAFLFGSEIKALLAHPLVKPVVGLEGIAEIFFIGPARTPGHGVFEDIHELRPGHYLFHNRNKTDISKYWSLKSMPHTDDIDSTTTCIRELFKDSVERQLVSDVPVCTFLSGGIDSSAISSYAADFFNRNGAGELHTYSIDYKDNERYFKADDFQPNSDPYWVRRVSEFLGTTHHYITVDTPELVEALTNSVVAKDLPGMADIDSSLYLFCKEIKKDAVVALSGECADEIFGGYPWFHRPELFNAGTFPWSLALKERTGVLSPELLKYLEPEEYVAQRYNDSLKEVPRLEGENEYDARRREIFYLNIVWFMNTLLDRKDRMSMAAGLEVRVPFCDHRLVEYVWNIPWWMKNYNGIEKGILRNALKGCLPAEVLERKKSPYPKTHNPSYMQAVSSWLLEILDNPTSPIHDLINTRKVRTMIEYEEFSFKRPWFGQLMNTPQLYAYLIQINFWLKEYKIGINM